MTTTATAAATAHDLDGPLLAAALLHGVRVRSGAAGWARAHAAVRDATALAVGRNPRAGLYRGAPAVGFVLQVADHPAYRTARERLDPVVDDLIRTRLATARRRMDAGHPARRSEFDLINGLTGLGALLLHRGRPSELLAAVLTYLIRLVDQPIRIGGTQLPGWWNADPTPGTPATPTPPARPTGHADFGMAHGIGGPIALLALSARAGHDVPGLRECLRRACDLLAERSRPTASGAVGWPSTADADHWTNPSAVLATSRPSWCYGTPGVARALQLAALACDHSPARRLAEDALTRCATDPLHLALLDNPTVCHGWAGFRLTVARAVADSDPASTLRHLMLAAAGPANHAPTTATGGLLTGPDGTDLADHSLDSGAPPARWTTCLLLD